VLITFDGEPTHHQATDRGHQHAETNLGVQLQSHSDLEAEGDSDADHQNAVRPKSG
jgi:hypothetical protein